MLLCYHIIEYKILLLLLRRRCGYKELRIRSKQEKKEGKKLRGGWQIKRVKVREKEKEREGRKMSKTCESS